MQTSYSIYNHHSGDINDSRSVLVKVIINENKPTIDHIIASTNSQNPVSPALLRATDKTQRELEIFFGNNGYYYDRRKSFYKNQNKPASKIFSIQTAAQAIESIIFENPYSARSKPTTLIKDDTTYNRIFNPENDFKAYLNCCLILKKTHDFWSEMTDPATKVKVSNFKLHLSRIAASFILSKANYSIGEINLMDLENYTEDLFNSSIQLLVTTIDLYQSEHTEANLINMAKAKGLTDKIIQALPSEFI